MSNGDDDRRQSRHEWDQRMYHHMVRRLEALVAGQLHDQPIVKLDQRITSLDTLFSGLEEDVDPSWAAKFFELLRDLGSIHASARDRGDRALSEEDTDQVRKIAESLERMVIAKLDASRPPRWRRM